MMTMQFASEAANRSPESGVEDVLGDGRLMKTIVVHGSGECPKIGRRVEVHYESVVVPTGTKIDSTWDRDEPFHFVLGAGDVLEAWDLGVATMRPGEKSEFVVHPSLGYGDDGAGDDIPAGAALRFTIELLGGEKPSVQVPVNKARQLPGEAQRLDRASGAKDRGNAFIKEQKFTDAREAYREALNVLRAGRGGDLDSLRAQNKLRVSCLLNLAQCDLKLEDFAGAIQHATEALGLEPESCKALYRRGLAHMALGGLQEGKADLLEALRLDPQNTEVRGRLEECRRKMADCQKWHKVAFGGMFGKAPEQRVTQRDLQCLPRVWLDVQIGGCASQRLKIVLYSDSVPQTAANFRALCTGERGIGSCGQPLHYKRTLVHKIVPKSLIEAGDIQNYDGSGGESIYGPSFDDECFLDTHHKRGLLSMANKGPHSNNSTFFITLRSLPQFDGHNVVFGEVVSGLPVLDQIEEVETEYPDRPVVQVAIVNCGEGW